MATFPPEITGRTATHDSPLAVTVQRARELTGLGTTTIWAFLKDGRLEAVRVAGIRRTLIDYGSLVRLLAPAGPSQSTRPRRRRAQRGTSLSATP